MMETEDHLAVVKTVESDVHWNVETIGNWGSLNWVENVIIIGHSRKVNALQM